MAAVAESVRRALAIQLIIDQEWGLSKNENPLQGSFARPATRTPRGEDHPIGGDSDDEALGVAGLLSGDALRAITLLPNVTIAGVPLGVTVAVVALAGARAPRVAGSS